MWDCFLHGTFSFVSVSDLGRAKLSDLGYLRIQTYFEIELKKMD